jgi:hypothetical protein
MNTYIASRIIEEVCGKRVDIEKIAQPGRHTSVIYLPAPEHFILVGEFSRIRGSLRGLVFVAWIDRRYSWELRGMWINQEHYRSQMGLTEQGG